MMTTTDSLILFLKDSELQDGGNDWLRDSALCCSCTWKWPGEVVSVIHLKGEKARCDRPCLQVCAETLTVIMFFIISLCTGQFFLEGTRVKQHVLY